jgi:hypothetical protein
MLSSVCIQESTCNMFALDRYLAAFNVINPLIRIPLRVTNFAAGGACLFCNIHVSVLLSSSTRSWRRYLISFLICASSRCVGIASIVIFRAFLVAGWMRSRQRWQHPRRGLVDASILALSCIEASSRSRRTTSQWGYYK